MEHFLSPASFGTMKRPNEWDDQNWSQKRWKSHGWSWGWSWWPWGSWDWTPCDWHEAYEGSPATPRTTVVLKVASSHTTVVLKVASSHLLAPQIRARMGQVALSPAFRAPQRVAHVWDKSHSRLHFAHSIRTISAEGCARMGQIALLPAFRTLDPRDRCRGLRAHATNRTLACVRALDTHDLRRGLRAHRTDRNNT